MTLPAEDRHVHHRDSGRGILVAQDLVRAVAEGARRSQFVAAGCSLPVQTRLLRTNDTLVAPRTLNRTGLFEAVDLVLRMAIVTGGNFSTVDDATVNTFRTVHVVTHVAVDPLDAFVRVVLDRAVAIGAVEYTMNRLSVLVALDVNADATAVLLFDEVGILVTSETVVGRQLRTGDGHQNQNC